MVSDKTRRDAFIEQNLGLVHACAGRFRGRGIEYDDLYSAGCMGLVKACDNFDESRGVCFSTYAVPVILGEIKKLFRDSGTVKVIDTQTNEVLGEMVRYAYFPGKIGSGASANWGRADLCPGALLNAGHATRLFVDHVLVARGATLPPPLK